MKNPYPEENPKGHSEPQAECQEDSANLSSHTLALRLKLFANILQSAPTSSKEEALAMIATASDLIEAARRLDIGYERIMKNRKY